MASPNDFQKAMQDMMSNFPMDNSALKDAFKNQAQMNEKMARVALQAAERSAEISSSWVKDAIARMGELTTTKDDPADYAKAMNDFASAAAEMASEHMSAFAEVAKKVQMETVDLMMSAGRDMAEDAQGMARKATEQATSAMKTTKTQKS